MKIFYHDSNIVVCEKPAGMLSESGGMPEALSGQLGGEYFCVHRLDRAVGGLMVYAGNAKAAAELSKLFQSGGVTKEYLAVVPDRLEQPNGEMTDLLFHDKMKNHSYVVKRMRAGVKQSRLAYEKLCSTDGFALVRVKLFTGRPHQIRCQFASRKMPLLGDVRYGSTVKDTDIALYSYHLSFIDPYTKKKTEYFSYPTGELWKRFENALENVIFCS
ncbi:MAG: RNA pseudouridine synthase [Eubacteriales bacterium]|nr:RNA pseudouridine synthase [Eubacteriales bacterium]